MSLKGILSINRQILATFCVFLCTNHLYYVQQKLYTKFFFIHENVCQISRESDDFYNCYPETNSQTEIWKPKCFWVSTGRLHWCFGNWISVVVNLFTYLWNLMPRSGYSMSIFHMRNITKILYIFFSFFSYLPFSDLLPSSYERIFISDKIMH